MIFSTASAGEMAPAAASAKNEKAEVSDSAVWTSPRCSTGKTDSLEEVNVWETWVGDLIWNPETRDKILTLTVACKNFIF